VSTFATCHDMSALKWQQCPIFLFATKTSDMSDMSTFFGTPALRVKVLLGARKTAGSRAIVACCACLFAKRFLPLVTMFLNKI
jgi:hypothetical protein